MVPDGVTARVGIPALERTIDAISINGRRASPIPVIGFGTDQQGDRVYQKGDRVYFTDVGPGHYTFDIRYSGTTPAYAPQPLVYPDPVKALDQDDATSGNWGGVYGKDGYVLMDYDNDGTNHENLPSYVQSVTCRRGKFTQWAHDVSDARVLASNAAQRGCAGMPELTMTAARCLWISA